MSSTVERVPLKGEKEVVKHYIPAQLSPSKKHAQTSVDLFKLQKENLAITIDLTKASESNETVLRMAFLIVGIGFLFPYNSVVTAVDFFQKLYGPTVDFYFGWCLIAPNFLLLSYSLRYGLPGSHFVRIVGSMVLMVVFTTIIPLQRGSAYIAYLLTLLLGLQTAVLQASLFNLLGFLGPSMMSAFQTGMGFGGVVVGALRIITKMALPGQIEQSCYLYFGVALLVLIVDMLVYIFIIDKSDRVELAVLTAVTAKPRSELKQKTSPSKMLSSPNRRKKIMKMKSLDKIIIDAYDVKSDDEDTALLDQPHLSYKTHSQTKSPDAGVKKPPPLRRTMTAPIEHYHKPTPVWKLFTISWEYVISEFINYVVTLGLFPGVMSLMTWDVSFADATWFPIFQIFLFNLTDTMGKYMCQFDVLRQKMGGRKSVLFASIARIIFVPWFIFCVKPLWLAWYWAVVGNIFMGFTNGFFGSLALCLAPESPLIPSWDKGRAAEMMVFSLTFGLTIGATLAIGINIAMQYW